MTLSKSIFWLLVCCCVGFAGQTTEKTQAEEFDAFLSNRYSKAQVEILKTSCTKSEAYSPFCYSILNRESLELKMKIIRASKNISKLKAQPTPIKFKNGKIHNWMEVRFASVHAILKGIGRLKPAEVLEVQKEALKESNCPNNAAIAVAAALEDELPEAANFEQLGDLYEKGAQCLVELPEERSVLLTRAGIFQFAGKKYEKAEMTLNIATKIKDVFKGRSLYWLYRTQLALSKNKDASKTVEQLQASYPFSFHTLIAMTSLKEDPGEILLNEPTSKLTRSNRNPHLNPLLSQVEILNKYRLENSAEKVLNWAIMEAQGAEPEVMLYLADLKQEYGSYQSTMNILSDILYKNPDLISKKTMEKYFPKVFFPIFEKNSHGVDPFLLISIARRESAFNSRALSSANARGLMQVVPARKGKHRSRINLFNPEDNIKAGSQFFSDLLGRVNGQVHLALAAYNAGPMKIGQWLSRYPVNEPVLFIDLIPYRETRDYVAAVMRNYYWYRRIHHTDKRAPASILGLSTQLK